MQVLVYMAEMVTPVKQRQFQVRLKSAQQAAIKWSEADCNRAIERLVCKIHQMTPVKCKCFEQVFQHHERQLSPEVGTQATGPRTKFGKSLAQMKTAAEEEVYGSVNMTTDKCVEFQVHLSDAETEAITSSMADRDRIVSQLERDIYSTISNEQMQFEIEYSIC
jgi:hypothetical protein